MRATVGKKLLKDTKLLNILCDSVKVTCASTQLLPTRASSHSQAEVANATYKNEPGVLLSRFPDILPPSNTNVLDLIWSGLERWGDLTALECSRTRFRYTYDEVYKYSMNFAASLINKIGLHKGDRVAIMIPNCPEYAVLFCGTLKAGGVCTTVNPGYKQFELSHQLKLTQPKLIITSNEYYPVISKTITDLKLNIPVMIIDRMSEVVPPGTARYSEFIQSTDTSILSNVKVELDDLAALLFSSGTTGLPKAVELTHKNLVYATNCVGSDVLRAASYTTRTNQDTVAAIIPLFHVYGLVTVMLGHLQVGCRLITIEKYTPDEFIDVLHKDRTNILLAVPPLIMFLAKDTRVKPDHLKSLRHVLSAAAPLAKSDIDILKDKTGGSTAFMQGYGLTESTSLCSSMFNGPGVRERDFDSSGEIVPNVKVKIVDLESGECLPPDTPGELWLSGPNVTPGYYRNAEATKDSFSKDGFFKTGDLAFYKANGDIYIKERIKELIKVKGLQVAPAELEALLRMHPAVAEAGVVGIPHEIYGEIPKAFVKLKADCKANEDEIIKFVEEQVASYKKIRELVFIDNIPKTNSGKILRRELKEMN